MEYKELEFTNLESRKEFLLTASCVIEEECLNKIIADGFLTAPASTRYHGAYQGGLFDHSINVGMTLVKLTNKLKLEWQNEDSPLRIGILHDLCKIDLYRYNSEEDKYEYDDRSLVKGHGIKSVIYATQKYGIKLTDEETACIIYHMGAFTDKSEWNDYSNAISKYPNVLWTHTADMIASKIMEV